MSSQNNLDAVPSSVSSRIEPFYISLIINRYKLSNYVIDFRAFDNVMLAKVANVLGLTLTKTFGKCFLMENKQDLLITQIKDAQFSFTAFPDKRVKMTSLEVDVPASYGMLLGRKFCKDVGGEINMDWSKERTPVKGEMHKLLPEEEVKYLVVKMDDLKSQIIFESFGLGTYFLQLRKIQTLQMIWIIRVFQLMSLNQFFSSEKSLSSQVVHSDDLNQVWTLEFDGSCTLNSFRVEFILFSPSREVFPYS